MADRPHLSRGAGATALGFTDIQKSPHYSGGMALRFARIFRIRDDKRADEADTLDTLRALFARQQPIHTTTTKRLHSDGSA